MKILHSNKKNLKNLKKYSKMFTIPKYSLGEKRKEKIVAVVYLCFESISFRDAIDCD